MSYRVLCVLPLLLIGLCAGVRAAEKTGPDVAVLNLEEVLNGAKAFTAKTDPLRAKSVEAETQLKALDQLEKDLKSKLELLGRNSPDAAKTSEDLELTRMRRKLLVDRTKAMIEKAQMEILVQGHEQITAALREFSKERGITIVHLAPTGRIVGNTLQDTMLQLGMQTVLYWDDSIDITKPFIAFLNARFAAEVAPAPAPAPAPDR